MTPAEAVERYPELAHFAGKPRKQVTLAAALDGYDLLERESRRETLAKYIAADKRGAFDQGALPDRAFIPAAVTRRHRRQNAK